MIRLAYAFILFTFIFFNVNAIAHGSVGTGSTEENQERTIVFPDTKNRPIDPCVKQSRQV